MRPTRRDRRWWRDVRILFKGTDSARYTFRRARRGDAVRYESIEPVPTGFHSTVWVAWRAGCGTIVSHTGRALWNETFTNLHQAMRFPSLVARQRAQLQADQIDSLGEGHRFVLVSRSRILSISPGRYRGAYSATLTDYTLLPDGVQRVATAMTDGMGLLDAATLRELIPARWRGVGGLAFVVDGKLANPYLLSDDGAQLHLFHTSGAAVPLPAFHRVETINRWSSVNHRSRFTRIYALSDTVRNVCRLYDGRIRAIVAEEIATSRAKDWRCEQLSRLVNDDSVQFLVFADPRGITHSYRVGARAITPMAHDIAGEALHVFRNGAMIVRRSDASGAARYETLRPDGTPYPNAVFTDIKVLGCGFVWVMRDGKWYSPGEDGGVSEKLGYPFSC
jgi:hypothetical protein